MTNNFLIVILVPTSVGKTTLAIDIAKTFGTEIISADSRQFFREMNIGTAKPTAEQLKSVKHHFIDSLSVKDEYNAGMFERDALNVLEEIFKDPLVLRSQPAVVPEGGNNMLHYLPPSGGRGAVMAGGSGLYINAVCNGFDEVSVSDKEVRKNLVSLYKEKGIEALQALLKKLDEEYFRKVDIKNPHRLIRAIEVCMITGKKYSELRQKEKAPASPNPSKGGELHAQSSPLWGDKRRAVFNIIKIGLEMEREKLYERINARVDNMMSEGLLEEVKSLASAYGGQGGKLNSMQTVGYKELFDYLDGKHDLPRAVELIKQNTRNFAKRQMTWFKKDKEIKWFNPEKKEEIIRYICEKIEFQQKTAVHK